MLFAPFSALVLLASQAAPFVVPESGCDFIGSPALAEPFFEPVVNSPYDGQVVPTNVIIRLGGPLFELDKEQPGLIPVLYDANFETVPLSRNVRELRPADGPLDGNATYEMHLVRTEHHSCPDCGSEQVVSFTTTAGEDLDPPPPPDVARLDFTLVPTECDFGQGNHRLHLTGSLDGDAEFVDIATVGRDGIVRRALSGRGWSPLDVVFTHGSDRFAIDDELRVALFTTDLAGHRSPPRIFRVSARPEGVQYDSEPARMCELPAAPRVHAPQPLPQNGAIVVEFPFESSPLGLDLGADITPLAKQTLSPFRERLLPAADLSGAEVGLTGLACPQCVCAGCQVDVDRRLTILEEADTEAPAAPRIISVVQSQPHTLRGGPCGPVSGGLVVTVEPGSDDISAVADLTYHASLRLDDDSPLLVGQHLVATPDEEGLITLHLDTRRYGEVFEYAVELTITAVDAAGNEAATGMVIVPDRPRGEAGGCAQTAPGSGLSLLGLLAVLLWRRREGSV